MRASKDFSSGNHQYLCPTINIKHPKWQQSQEVPTAITNIVITIFYIKKEINQVWWLEGERPHNAQLPAPATTSPLCLNGHLSYKLLVFYHGNRKTASISELGVHICHRADTQWTHKDGSSIARAYSRSKPAGPVSVPAQDGEGRRSSHPQPRSYLQIPNSHKGSMSSASRVSVGSQATLKGRLQVSSRRWKPKKL